jgi:deazaflavin-dependent oxidoreductase (nitroreductase family)
MAEFSRDVIEAAAQQREVQITTYGRKTGRPYRVTVWLSGDNGRLFVRSGGGLGRDWPQNMMAGGRGMLHVGGMDVPVRARHVTDAAEARAAAGHLVRKYRVNIERSSGGQPLTPGEQATFELLPAAT